MSEPTAFAAWWRRQLVPPRPTAAQIRRAAREAFAAGVAAERARCLAAGGTADARP